MKGLMVFLLLMAIFIIAPILANYGEWIIPNGVTGNFKAYGTKQVTILNEKLDIVLLTSRVKVRVQYIMKNTGKAVKVRAGFPTIIPYYEKSDLKKQRISVADYIKKYNKYSIKVNGGLIKSKFRKDKNIQLSGHGIEGFFKTLPSDNKFRNLTLNLGWFVSTIRFKSGEKKTITINYETSYLSQIGSTSGVRNSYSPEYFYYFLSTGATWKGPIKKGQVTIRTLAVNANKLSLKPRKNFIRRGNIFYWNFFNLEPSKKHDIVIGLNNPYISNQKGNWSYNNVVNGRKRSYKIKHFYTKFNGQFYLNFFPAKVKASSNLKSYKKITYEATHVKDGFKDTAWVEGKPGSGIGEYVVCTLEKPTKLAYIAFIPGYSQSEKLYFENNRLRTAKVIINNHYKVTKLFIDDYSSYPSAHPKAYQYIDVSHYKKKIKTIKIIITSVYRGSKYNDTAISEIILLKKIKQNQMYGRGR